MAAGAVAIAARRLGIADWLQDRRDLSACPSFAQELAVPAEDDSIRHLMHGADQLT